MMSVSMESVSIVKPIALSVGKNGQSIEKETLDHNSFEVFCYKTSAGEQFVGDILKEQNTRLIVAPEMIAYLQSADATKRMMLTDFGQTPREISRLIRRQVTGEDFVMTEVLGEGHIRLSPTNNQLQIRSLNNTFLNIINVYNHYLTALAGEFDLINFQKINLPTPINYTRILVKKGLGMFEAGEFYEVRITTEFPIFVNAKDVNFWTGDLVVDSGKLSSPLERDLIYFSGNGKLYLSLAQSV
ncbi:MAG: hypothetical protein SFT81_06015 [Candidatus Caenarcaniphilales bacterium]|nr:hypothetical protein [Candidatus Caenarcaniphilales bacterium]